MLADEGKPHKKPPDKKRQAYYKARKAANQISARAADDNKCTEIRRAAQKRYHQSAKGKETSKRYREQVQEHLTEKQLQDAREQQQEYLAHKRFHLQYEATASRRDEEWFLQQATHAQQRARRALEAVEALRHEDVESQSRTDVSTTSLG